MKRCFVGMRVDEEARERIALVQRELARLPRSAARKMRPVRPESLHATVKFLGATADAQVPELAAALAEAARGFAPRVAPLGGFGAFPSAGRPRILFAEVLAEREHLNAVAAAVDAAVVALGFSGEERPHVPHVTVARVEQPQARGPLTEWLAAAPRAPLGHVQATHLVLFESALDDAGARYVTLAELPLGGGPA